MKHLRGVQCSECGAWRSRLHKCVTCSKDLCGCCSFRSRAGRVCPGQCHRAALTRHTHARDGEGAERVVAALTLPVAAGGDEGKGGPR